ncbi:MAG: TonB-dependent receptor [Gammaproteobacteria bacterium]|nr:TonB-dependent receptor [Gammaproteobacteria bacterium]
MRSNNPNNRELEVQRIGTGFAKSPIAAGISVALGLFAAAPAFAQDADTEEPEQIEEVYVTGIRASLQSSQDTKRDSSGIVDAITAEDIGKFPDTNLAESLQRITGVSIDRSRGEGSKVTVRGFGPDYNLVLLNGRQMPTASGTSRSFDFGNLASEGVSSVEVYKTGKAHTPTGGIGATLNIRTTRPLENPGLNATVGLKGVHDTSTHDGDSLTPEISGLFSNTFADDTIGVALTAVHQVRDSGANTASVGGWRTFDGAVDNCWCGAGPSEWGGIPPQGDPNQVNRPGPGDLYSVPQNIGYEFADYHRVRNNGQLTLQWEPIADLRATLDYTYSEVELERTYSNYSAWFNFGAQETVWTDGPQASPLVYTENLAGSDFAMGAGTDAWRTENNSIGLNVDWSLTDSLTLNFDYHDSSAEYEPNSKWGDSALVSMASFTRDRTTGYFGDEFPVLELGLSRPLNKDDMIVTGSVFTNNVSKMDIEQTTLGGNWELDFGIVESLDFGVQLTEVNNRSAGSVVQRDAWGGVTQPGAISDLLTDANAAGEFDQFDAGNDSRLQTDYYTWDMEEIIKRTEELMASGQATTWQLADMGDCGTGFCPSSNFTSDRRTTEESSAIYVQANMATELSGMPVYMNLGVRYEKTDVSSQALSPAYTSIEWVSGNEIYAILAPDAQFTELSGSYDVLLPNFDFNIELTDDLVARASIGKTMSRPDYGSIQGGQTIGSLLRVDGGNGNRGNPNLKPLESLNFDLSLEWYYDDASYASVGYFKKDVKNFIGTDFVEETTFNLAHPANGPLYQQAVQATGSSDSGTIYNYIINNFQNEPGVNGTVITGVDGRDGAAVFELAVPVNQEDATLDGWELAWQHAFGESGFGFIVNATIVDGDVEYDNFNTGGQFALTGLSDSANFIAFYEDFGFSTRVAYNWRDDFLAGTGQVNVGAGPTYVAAYGQWDLNASYEIGEHFNVFVEALNVTNETTHVYGRDTMQTLFASQLGPRYNFGVRYKF